MKSHPSWVRGLKQMDIILSSRVGLSHPSWVRGLKPTLITMISMAGLGRTPRGCVD